MDAVVATLVISGILSSVLLIFKLYIYIFIRSLLVSTVLKFLTTSSYLPFLTTLLFTTSLSLLKSLKTSGSLSASNLPNLLVELLKLLSIF